MANTLTTLIPKALAACQEVFSEKASLVNKVDMRYSAIPAAVNEAITIPTVPTVAGVDRTPAMVPTIAANRTSGSTTVTITKDRAFPFHMTGDDYLRIRQNPEYIPESLKQAIRAARNEIHSDLADLHVNAAGYYSASTGSSGAAVGTAGTVPFGSDLTVLTSLEKFLNDSLCPQDDRFLLINTDAKRKLGDLGQLIKANEAGTDDLLRRGIIGQLAGFNVIWDQVVKQWSPIGTGASYVANGVSAAGSTSLVVKTGSGTILAGDVVTVTTGGVATKYVVATGIAAAGTLVLTSGLVAATVDGDTVTVDAISRRHMAFHRTAMAAVVRPSAVPPNGDSAADTAIITDPVSGVSMRLSNYKGYGLDQNEIQVAWGVKAVRPELLKLLLG